MLNKKILDNDANGSEAKGEIVRVIKPGVFDYQTKEFMIRMRAWGVGFPKRDQPGYNEAITFTEQKLLSTLAEIEIKQEFVVGFGLDYNQRFRNLNGIYILK